MDETSPVTFDAEADALYVRLRDGSSARQAMLDDARIIDYSEDGAVIGVEFLGASDGVDLDDVPFAPTVASLIHDSGLPIRVLA